MRAPRLSLLFFASACASAPAPAPVPAPVPALAPAPALASPPAPAPTLAAPLASPPAPLTVSDADRLADANASNEFTTRLYARARRAPGNVLISGTSVRHALGVVALGARLDTAREMTTALGLPADRAQRSALAAAETAAWDEARGAAQLVLGNAVWVDPSFTLKPEFIDGATTSFGARVAAVDFANGPDVARRAINTWAAESTSHKIEDLLAAGTVDRTTRLVVSNVIYLKARWSSPFATGATKSEAFAALPGGKALVPTMHASSVERFAHVGAARVLDLRCAGSQLSMLFVLPDDAAGLGKLEESVSSGTFESWTAALRPHRVTISLPRFKFQSGGSLDAALQDLGMRAAYGAKADLTDIAEPVNGERLHIARVVQRTYVAVDENGVEAAAATAVGMSVTSAFVGPTADFKADRPFLFFVYDAKGGGILFAGRVTDPRS